MEDLIEAVVDCSLTFPCLVLKVTSREFWSEFGVLQMYITVTAALVYAIYLIFTDSQLYYTSA